LLLIQLFAPLSASQEEIMGRKYIDCREAPSVSGCTVAISADRDEELLEAAVQHAVAVHGHKDSAELRGMIKKGIKETKQAAIA
jgi:predicted small metal-binding protein